MYVLIATRNCVRGERRKRQLSKRPINQESLDHEAILVLKKQPKAMLTWLLALAYVFRPIRSQQGVYTTFWYQCSSFETSVEVIPKVTRYQSHLVENQRSRVESSRGGIIRYEEKHSCLCVSLPVLPLPFCTSPFWSLPFWPSLFNRSSTSFHTQRDNRVLDIITELQN